MFIITGFHIEEHHIEAVLTERYSSAEDIASKNSDIKVLRSKVREEDIHTFKFELYRIDIIKLDVTPYGILLFGDDLLNHTTTSN